MTINGISATGRPRKFDEATAVHDATMVFWRHGYAATTSAMLTAGTGLNPSSLYNTFRSKHGLFLAALEHYNQMLSERLLPLTQGRDGLADIEKFLRQLRQAMQGKSAIQGCLMANTLGEGIAGNADVSLHTTTYEQRIHSAFRIALERAVSLGEVDASAPEPASRILVSAMIGALVTNRNKLLGIDEHFTETLMAMLGRRSNSPGVT